LLKKQEIKKLKTRVDEKGLTVVLTRLFINEKGLCKVEIALARGKKIHDKRETIKERDLERSLRRNED
jgi:SsrA-binding protein